MKATRKPAKGGLANAMFVQATAEELPDELHGVVNNIHINFPWGSLLRAVATGDEAFLASLRSIAARGCSLEIVIGVDSERDRTELDRLGIPELTSSYLRSGLIPKYKSTGFRLRDHQTLSPREWTSIATSWARRLQPNTTRKVVRLVFDVD